MDQKALKDHIQQTFDTICKGYDCASLRFFNNAAEKLPDIFNFKGDEKLLDIATGTGIPALVCASQLPDGSV
ncbi:MAG: methyltransferase type 11, partial [Gammaproteobacteria bacterium]|nr:methyltransferase type 11 [Gammaproteobacteria bacterium]